MEDALDNLTVLCDQLPGDAGASRRRRQGDDNTGIAIVLAQDLHGRQPTLPGEALALK